MPIGIMIPFILVTGFCLVFAALLKMKPVARVLLFTHVKFVKWLFKRNGECNVDLLSDFYAKLFLSVAVVGGSIASLIAANIFSEALSHMVMIISGVLLATLFIPTYTYLLIDETYFKK